MKRLLMLCVIALCSSCAGGSIESKIKSAESYKYRFFSSSYELVDMKIDSAFMTPKYDSLCRIYANICSKYSGRSYSLRGDSPVDSVALYRKLLVQRASELSGEFVGWVAEHRFMYKDRETSYGGRLAIAVYDSLAQNRIFSYDGLREHSTDVYIDDMFGKRENESQ